MEDLTWGEDRASYPGYIELEQARDPRSGAWRLNDKSGRVYREVGGGNILQQGKVEQGRFLGLGNFSIRGK